jgi:tetratricopeptide (TPR) repeat protein/calcineurin-like phosphoesterase family protein
MRKLFVVMPFGQKPADHGHAVSLIDFDAVYRDLIRPAALAAELEVLRIDEVLTPGGIDHQYLREIFAADLMLADVSVPNANVYYELGIRQAISTGATVLIALEGSSLPFDIQNQRVLFYGLTNERIAEDRLQLEKVLRSEQVAMNPVRWFLENLGLQSNPQQSPGAFQQDLQSRIQRAVGFDQLVATWNWAKRLSPLPIGELITLAHRFGELEATEMAVEVLRRGVDDAPKDFEAHRLLGWYAAKLGPGHEQLAEASFERALLLNPDDPETLGMRGGYYKRRGRLEDAARSYARGAQISPKSLYMRVNAAALAVLTQPHDPADGVALYQGLLADLRRNTSLSSDPWADLVGAEAAFATGDQERARRFLERGMRSTSAEALRSARTQFTILGEAGFRTTEAADLARIIDGYLDERPVPELACPIVSADGERPVIIHLSDLHFGCREVAGALKDMHRFCDGEYTKRLSVHLLEELQRELAVPVDPARLVLVISGDLTYRGTSDEFTLVRTFLDELCEHIPLAKERVVLTPGNHDVHWASAREDLAKRFDNYIAFLVNFYGEDLFRSLYPRMKWDLRVDTERDKPQDLIGIHVVQNATIASLNSCVYETQQDHYGFVGGRQLQHLEGLLARTPVDAVARVAVLHHHLHPFPESLDVKRASDTVWMDLSTVRDAGLVERRLEKLNFDLVLHGHKHKAQIRETLVRDKNEHLVNARRLIVCGAGSTGVDGSELGGEPNHYEVIEIVGARQSDVDFVRVAWRELSLVADSDWLTSQRWNLQG